MKTKYYRNIGICAHIDAGKTSVTERILYYTGKKHFIGEVHDGEAAMDWMDQEKERGITICSAVTTVYWSGFYNKLESHKINIIDTPGHIDFTAEVERSLRILDGVCLVFCAVGGVQPQTEVIWRQINNYNIPCIGFINKLDRINIEYTKIIHNISKALDFKCIPLNYPVYKDKKIVSIIDLLELKRIIYTDNNGLEFNIFKIDLPDQYIKMRNNILETLVDYDDNCMNMYLSNSFPVKLIYNLIRRLTIEGKIMPIFCGSALKNRGIQLLLDGIVRYLPSPDDCLNNIKLLGNSFTNKIKKFSALIFKIINDEYSCKLFYIRIYSGILRSGDIVYNSITKIREKINRLLEINVNKRIEIFSSKRGDIIAIQGLKHSNTGDSLCEVGENICYRGIEFPKPVISVSVNSKNKAEYNTLINLIKKYAIEDPTIEYKIDSDSGKCIISGMGELHIEVFLEKIFRICKVKFNIGKPVVRFRETIINSIYNIEGKYIKQSGGRGQYGHVVINLINTSFSDSVKVINKIKGGVIPNEYIEPIIESLLKICNDGYLYGYTLTGFLIEIVDGSFHEVDSSEIAFKNASICAIKNALNQVGVKLLEPIMLMNIVTPIDYLGIILGNIVSKRGVIKNTCNIDNNQLIIKALIPMAELFNYSTVIRSLTKGRATFNLEFNNYKLVPDHFKL